MALVMQAPGHALQQHPPPVREAGHHHVVAAGFVASKSVERRRQLRDLLLRFPCASLEGVRSTVLWRVYCERCGIEEERHQQLPPAEELRGWLGDIAEFEEDASSRGDGLWRLKAAAALTQGTDGQLACWPLFLQRLGEIVRMHGNPQHAHALEVPHEEGTSEEIMADSSGNVVGVLLAQLKSLLRRHWDSNFEEKAVSFFSETGAQVNVKKMKHLVAETLKWRARRRVLQQSRLQVDAVDTALEAPIFLAVSQRHNDMVLCCQVQLAVAQELNAPEMGQQSHQPQNQQKQQEHDTRAAIPRVASASCSSGCMSPARRLEAHATAQNGNANLEADPARASPARETREAALSGDRGLHRRPPALAAVASDTVSRDAWSSWADMTESENCADTSLSTQGDSESSASRSAPWCDVPDFTSSFENESMRLRIENAELKKKLRFDVDRYQKEIRRLRVENAELKKRLFITTRYARAENNPGSLDAAAPTAAPAGAPGVPPGMPAVHPVWVPAQTVLAPVVHAPPPPAGAGATVGDQGGSDGCCASQMRPAVSSTMPCPTSPPTTLPSSGQVSPCHQGSLTPIHSFCYAMPIPPGMVSPNPSAAAAAAATQPWANALGPPWMAALQVGMCPADSAPSIMSPFSDQAKAEGLIPKSLFGSDPTSIQSRTSLASHSAVCTPSRQPTEFGGTVQMRCSDDRWASIPSGIVERQKAQFEAGPGPGGIDPSADSGAACGDAAAGGQLQTAPPQPPLEGPLPGMPTEAAMLSMSAG